MNIYLHENNRIQKVFRSFWKENQHLFKVDDVDLQYFVKYQALREFYKNVYPYQFLGTDDCVVQCGFHYKLINWGVSQPLIMSAIVGNSGHVFAIDSDDENFNVMNSFIHNNSITNMTIFKNVVWSSDSEIGFIFKETRQNVAVDVVKNSRPHGEGRGGSRGTVVAKKLDTILGNQKIDFINLTVNGAEKDILLGSGDILSNNKNACVSIALKTNENWLYDIRIPALDILYDMGYNIAVGDSHPHPWSKEKFLFACAVKTNEDILHQMGFRKYSSKNLKDSLEKI